MQQESLRSLIYGAYLNEKSENKPTTILLLSQQFSKYRIYLYHHSKQTVCTPHPVANSKSLVRGHPETRL